MKLKKNVIHYYSKLLKIAQNCSLKNRKKTNILQNSSKFFIWTLNLKFKSV
ncbi:hypothetical protein BMY_2165 [Wohlfahrtiimonas chitiniclastica]|nr:hypothetical protein BMY_2165 [Wohlfahrtiimonas chitiniclastica]